MTDNSLRPGDRLDHYRIEELAAHGGMSCVYRATDLRDGRVVAVKVPHFEVELDPLLFDRFKREEGIGKRLDHCCVMKVFENGEASRLYMVMEWIDGKLLRHLLTDETRFSPERAANITLQICEALSYIHAQGVVHRDLKPENVIITSDDRIKLIDFGIASNARARRLTFGKMTRVMGTADYISPEQVKSNRSDARSDVYSLGVMFYEMLTGEMPFQGPTPLAVMNDRLLNNPKPPRELNAQISPAMQEIIYRALERDPKNRYARASEFANDLRNPDSVGVSDRRELNDWKTRRTTRPKTVMVYAGIAMIPITIFVLLLIAATHH
jgi:serine/threonine-protein kinase